MNPLKALVYKVAAFFAGYLFGDIEAVGECPRCGVVKRLYFFQKSGDRAVCESCAFDEIWESPKMKKGGPQ